LCQRQLCARDCTFLEIGGSAMLRSLGLRRKRHGFFAGFGACLLSIYYKKRALKLAFIRLTITNLRNQTPTEAYEFKKIASQTERADF